MNYDAPSLLLIRQTPTIYTSHPCKLFYGSFHTNGNVIDVTIRHD